ncbi:AglZ/HisF2 family acetamidino modification protein [Salidesulfovibrio onnuriiensis]|uniref:AglZ/HisF2 family acetamidino modification protein n=1 Tax=Salidesulfovibrio onnuriiensis TaxID=2583823 RepID=UPI0011CAFAA9|nr:AglZ/HisF2 family acetamidino modification protein [Salidesulfovibrio onnuriiensis]
MLIPRVIPCLLLQNDGLVKTTRFKNSVYVGDPINTVKILNDKEVDELFFLDISATPAGKTPPLELLARLADECFMPFGYGGGITTVEQMHSIFSLGAEKVVLNTAAVENPDLVHKGAKRFGSQSIVVSLDVTQNWLGKYTVRTHGGRQKTGRPPLQLALQMEKAGAGELLINSIPLDGTMKGYDLKLIKMIADAVDIPVVACGGAGTVKDFSRAVHKAGASAVAAGSMFVFQGPHRAVLINYPQRDLLENTFGTLIDSQQNHIERDHQKLKGPF